MPTKKTLEATIGACDALIVSLQKLRGELAAEAYPPSAPEPAPPAGPTVVTAKPPAEPAALSTTDEAVYAAIAEGAESASDIGAATKLDAPAVRLAVKHLLAAERIVRTGKKRGTRYHVIGGAVPAMPPRTEDSPPKTTLDDIVERVRAKKGLGADADTLTTTDLVAQQLDTEDGRTLKQIATALGLEVATVQACMAQLMADGRAEREEHTLDSGKTRHYYFAPAPAPGEG